MFMVNIRRLKAVGELMKQSTCPNNVKIRLNQINLIMIMTTSTSRTSGTKMSVWCDICSFYPMQFVTVEDNQCSAWDALKRPSKKTSMLEFFFSLVLPSLTNSTPYIMTLTQRSTEYTDCLHELCVTSNAAELQLPTMLISGANRWPDYKVQY